MINNNVKKQYPVIRMPNGHPISATMYNRGVLHGVVYSNDIEFDDVLLSNVITTSTVVANLNVSTTVSSNILSSGLLLGTVTVSKLVNSAISTTSNITADVKLAYNLLSSLTTSSSVVGNLTIPKLVSTSLVSTGTIVADLSVSSATSSLLLDTYPNAAAAYSLRKLRTAYSGSAVRVRRSSDNTEQDIGFTGNNLNTTELTTFVGAGNGFVTTWYDQSGNAQNATQTTQASQPRIVNSGVVQLTNSKPSLYFDGVNDFLTGSALSNYITASTFSNISVFNPIVLTTNNTLLESNDALWIDSTNGYAGVFFKSTNNLFAGVYSNVLHQVSIPITANTQITSFAKLVSGNVSISKNNGTFANATASNITVLTNNLTIARSNVYAELNAQEIIFYKTDQTSNVNEMNTNINTYYAIY